MLQETKDDVENLVDAVEEHSEEFVQVSTVSALIQVKRFMKPLLQAHTTIDDVLDKFTKCLEIGVEDVLGNIDVCSSHLHSLENLYRNVANRGEVTKSKIHNILTGGKIEINVNR